MLAKLVYRSRAVQPLSAQELSQLTSAAQSRNRCESITGLMLYDESRFFQWLEGPTESLNRIMESIRNDPRHTEIEVLADQPADGRLFSGWNMQLAMPSASGDAIDPPHDVVEGLRRHPETAPSLLIKLMPASFGIVRGDTVITDTSLRLVERTEAILENVIRSTVAPMLVHRTRLTNAALLVPPVSSRTAELAKLLTAADADASLDLVKQAQDEASAASPLFSSLFEPAARRLGDLWGEDLCSEFDVTLGLCRLQTAARMLGGGVLPPVVAAGLPVVLVAPEPGEIHGLSAALDSEVMWAAGWAPHQAFPVNDKALQDLLAATWFDVLDLSLSAAFLREDWLPRMTRTIGRARIASRNPALLVVVGGRMFVEQEHAGAQVGADLATTTAAHVDDHILRALGAARHVAATPKRRRALAN
jgi:hypothetical protein